MEEPILFLCLILQKLGLPSGERFYQHVYQEGGQPSLLAKLVAPHMVYGYLAIVIILVLAIIGTRKLEFIPKGLQNFWETFLEALYNFTRENVPTGDHGSPNLVPLVYPLIVMFTLFIGISNFMGLVPGFICPTANLNVTLGLTLITIVYYHFLGLRFQGLRYFKTFLGPIPWLVPLMLPIEIFGHIGRIISLSVRLFANMMSKELLLGILITLAGPFFAPLPILLLGVLVAVIQVFIFIILSLAYFAGAVEEAH
ncbi:F0F1 ATP synthase subunit A [Thermosulfurimonas dismutans]|uniref:ATP synthase subunit a n=1 Tax=Thermosulfurimonas dismutans TaxID=999894 RepID=A0A179D6U4_9BACT|nr:F0F1 ATP synthase subunit A [Thermosulfurimonas dismutans]OAQ21767.1 ATP synthase A chain [Thermosulfurimonas dismutans]